MDNQVYKTILNGLKEYSKTLKYKCSVYSLPPRLNDQQTIKFPFARFYQVGNTQNPAYNSCFDRVSSVRYVIDIFAQDLGTKVLRNEIAMGLAQQFDDFLSNECGLLRVGYNEFDLELQGSTYRISMTYSGNLHENRRRFI